MDDTELLHTSRREHALYRELAAAYHAMASALRDERAPVDPTWLGTTETRAEATVAALRNTAAELAPYRLSGAAVPESVEPMARPTRLEPWSMARTFIGNCQSPSTKRQTKS